MPTIPTTGSYPKMVTATDVSGRTVPAVFPAGDALQFTIVFVLNCTEEAAFNAGTGKFANTTVAITTVAGPHSNSLENGWKKK